MGLHLLIIQQILLKSMSKTLEEAIISVSEVEYALNFDRIDK